MKKRIFDEKNGLWYELHGDYYLPCLLLPEEKLKPIGVWGQRHLRYIKEHRKIFYVNMLISCELNEYLSDIDKQAKEMFIRLVDQMAKNEGVTEYFKAKNQMEWVRSMNNIRHKAMEIVNHDVIYA